jgi:hypothetical protein
MRFLLKIPVPTEAENPAAGQKDFDAKLRNLFTEVGALSTYSTQHEGRRIEWVIVDVGDLALITPMAKFIFGFLKVKPEFVPELTPKPYFRRVGY